MFILLFVGHLGELRVILTKRSSKLRTFPGHVSLPGGKADTEAETEWDVSRREMHEEIGLNENNSILLEKYGFEVKHLKVMPSYLSRTFSAVRPCVGFMPNPVENLELALNPGESSSIFSCPLRDFLYPIKSESLEALKRSHVSTDWCGIPWELRSYTFPQENKNEAAFLRVQSELSESEDDELISEWGPKGLRRDSDSNEKIYDVWGLTGNILHDLAEIVYVGKSDREMGEEKLIHAVWKGGEMRGKKRSEVESRWITGEGDFGDIVKSQL